MSRLKLEEDLGIRRRIIFIFCIFSVVVVSCSLIFVRIWLFSFYENTKIRVLKKGYENVLAYFQLRGALLEALAQAYAQDPQIVRVVSEPSGSAPTQLIRSLEGKYGLQGVLLFNSKGRLVYEDIDFVVKASNKALARIFSGPAPVSGFWHTAHDDLWFLASVPILDPSPSQEVVGRLIFCFNVADEFIGEMSRRLGLKINIFHNISFFEGDYFGSSPLVYSLRVSWEKLRNTAKAYSVEKGKGMESGGDLFLDTLITDVNAAPIGVLRIQEETKFFSYFGKEMLVLLWFIFVFFAFSFFWIINFLARHITVPLVTLKRAIEDIASSGDLSRRITFKANDELGSLIAEFNNMLETLEKMNKRIKTSGEELSRLYGDLLEQKHFTSEILSLAPSIVLMLMPDARIRYVNEAIEEITGFKKEESLGRNWFEQFIPFGARNDVRAAFDEIIRGNIEPYRQKENTILTKDGQERLILWSNNILKKPGGEVEALICVGQDITQLKAMESELVKKIHDLERFYRVAMDREKVIASLKKQIGDLKNTSSGPKGQGAL